MNFETTESGLRQGLHGFWFRSDDKSRIVQCRSDGFTFNRLKPYDDWDALRPEAIRAWELYVSAARPIHVTRVALRYINRFMLDIDAGGLGFDEYLESPPRVPEGLKPGEVNRYLSRLTLVEPRTDIRSNVTQVVEPPERGSFPVTLDIDVFKAGKFGVAQGDLVDTLDALREKKNQIFFGSLKEPTMKLFQ